MKTLGIRGFELEMRAKNGDRVACLVSAEAVAINDDQRVLCVLQDVTVRKRSEEELIAAIEQVMADASWFSRSIVEKLAALRRPVSSPSGDAELEDLTGRERDVLGLICQGRNDAEIGEVLKLSRNTVRNHLASLYRKLGVNRRAAAIVWARERGITGQLAPKKRPRRCASSSGMNASCSRQAPFLPLGFLNKQQFRRSSWTRIGSQAPPNRSRARSRKPSAR